MKKKELTLKSHDTTTHPKVKNNKNNNNNNNNNKDEASPPEKKTIRKESSIGTTNTLRPIANTLQNLTIEEINKNTQIYNYNTAIATAKEIINNNGGDDCYYKLISWNVAGLRALLKDGYNGSELEKLIIEEKPDVLCLQETKLSSLHSQEPIISSVINNYTFIEAISTAKKGYSGTRTYIRDGVFDNNKSIHYYDFDMVRGNCTGVMDPEGRICASILYPNNNTNNNNNNYCDQPICIVNTYVPNAGMSLERLDYRIMDFDKIMRNTLKERCPAAINASMNNNINNNINNNNNIPSQQDYNIIWTGDLNVAERDYDRFHNNNYKSMQQSAGFTPIERQSFRTTLLDCNMVDCFREQYPNHRGAYTFFSKMRDQKASSNGWRLDYFIASMGLRNKGRLAASAILYGYSKSDHVPLVLWLRK